MGAPPLRVACPAYGSAIQRKLSEVGVAADEARLVVSDSTSCPPTSPPATSHHVALGCSGLRAQRSQPQTSSSSVLHLASDLLAIAIAQTLADPDPPAAGVRSGAQGGTQNRNSRQPALAFGRLLQQDAM